MDWWWEQANFLPLKKIRQKTRIWNVLRWIANNKISIATVVICSIAIDVLHSGYPYLAAIPGIIVICLGGHLGNSLFNVLSK